MTVHLERSSTGIPCGDRLSSHNSQRAGHKALVRLSKGGHDRDLILVESATGKVLERSMLLNKTCVCSHDKLEHVPKCSRCPCLRYEVGEREERRVERPGGGIVKPW